MKKFYCVLGSVFFLLMMTVTSFASSINLISLSGVGITSIELPDYYQIITKDLSDAQLSQYGISREEVNDYFKEDDLCLLAWDQNVHRQFAIFRSRTDSNDFSTLSSSDLSEYASFIKDQYEGIGYSVQRCEVFSNTKTSFIKNKYSFYSDDSGTVYSLDYTTNHEGYRYLFTFQSFLGNIDNQLEKEVQDIIDSILFTSSQQPVSNPIPQPSALNSSPISFAPPQNWSESSFPSTQSPFFIRYVLGDNSNKEMQIGCVDFWTELPSFDQERTSREDFNDCAQLESFLPSILDKEISSSLTIPYGQKYYLQFEIYGMKNASGTAETMVCLCTLDNGYAYFYLTNIPVGNPSFKEFTSYISHIEYPSHSEKKLSHSRLFFDLLFSIFVTLLLHPFPIFLYRFVILKNPISPKKAIKIVLIDCLIVLLIYILLTIPGIVSKISILPIAVWGNICYFMLTKGYKPEVENTTPNKKNVTVESRLHSCSKCGAKVPQESNFCPKCGHKLQ